MLQMIETKPLYISNEDIFPASFLNLSHQMQLQHDLKLESQRILYSRAGGSMRFSWY